MRLVFAFLAIVYTANAQLLILAETMGKEKKAIFLSPNVLWTKNTPFPGKTLRSTYNFGQYWRGVSNRIDLAIGAGTFGVEGEYQANVSAGGNIHLFKEKSSGLAVSTYQLVGFALHRRTDSCAAWWFPTLVASRTFKTGNDSSLSPYAGYTVFKPLGHNRESKLFTAPDAVHNFPAGLAWSKGRYAWFVEYGFGRKTTAVSIGLAITL